MAPQTSTKLTYWVFRRIGERFARIAVGDTLTTPLLPNFELRLRDLFL